MKNRLIFYIIFSFFLTRVGFPQEKKPALHNPFLTPEEEMEELGIKAPLKKKVKEEVSLKGLVLTGIIYGKEKFAIINSDFYKEGDSLGDFKIKEIKPLSVILIIGGKEKELKLKHVLACSPLKSEKEEEKLETQVTEGSPGVVDEKTIEMLRERKEQIQEIFKK